MPQPKFVDSTDTEKVLQLLKSIPADAVPVYGLMSPQHAVEHLILLYKISNGKMFFDLQYAPEKAAKFKHYVINTDNEFTPGFKAPILPVDKTLPYQYKNIDEAFFYLKMEMDAFAQYFTENPTAKTVNPTLGALQYDEWVLFHDKHITHHLKQFGVEI